MTVHLQSYRNQHPNSSDNMELRDSPVYTCTVQRQPLTDPSSSAAGDHVGELAGECRSVDGDDELQHRENQQDPTDPL